MGIMDRIMALKDKALNLTTKYKGNKDFLEAVCASAALVAAADGTIDDKEIEVALSTMENNKAIAGAFPASEIRSTLDRMLKNAMSASGKVQLARELQDVRDKGDKQFCEDVYLIAVDVASADGNVADAEKATLQKIAGKLGVDPSKFEF